MAVMLFNCLFISFPISSLVYHFFFFPFSSIVAFKSKSFAGGNRTSEKLISYNYILKSEIEKKRRQKIGSSAYL